MDFPGHPRRNIRRSQSCSDKSLSFCVRRISATQERMGLPREIHGGVGRDTMYRARLWICCSTTRTANLRHRTGFFSLLSPMSLFFHYSSQVFEKNQAPPQSYRIRIHHFAVDRILGMIVTRFLPSMVLHILHWTQCPTSRTRAITFSVNVLTQKIPNEPRSPKKNATSTSKRYTWVVRFHRTQQGPIFLQFQPRVLLRNNHRTRLGSLRVASPTLVPHKSPMPSAFSSCTGSI
jgi:hypothetical protein